MKKWLAIAIVFVWPAIAFSDGIEEPIKKGIKALQFMEYDSAIGYFTHAVTLQPDCSDAYYLRAMAQLQKSDFKLAIHDASEAVRLKDGSWAALKLRALAYLAIHDSDHAIEDLSAALAINPKDGSFYRHRGEAYTANKNYNLALQDFEMALKLSSLGSSDPYVRNSRAIMYLEKGDNDLALRDFDTAIDSDPTCASAYRGKARIQWRKKAYPEAIATLQNALQYAANDPETLDCLARYWATCPDPKVREGKKSLQYAVQVCSLTNWKKASPVATLAAAYAENGQFEVAVRCQKLAITLASDETQESLKKVLSLYTQNSPYRDE